ncbi:hypothetical protein [Reichenbachiella versicolor]|uniref:hypothetical protein n=1 Tax=Reichenbachiella versicolor TaxID=1821036 RepID=UPI000D6E6685|nr:hypothetical protein [Reichenbachiella versicolor]
MNDYDTSYKLAPTRDVVNASPLGPVVEYQEAQTNEIMFDAAFNELQSIIEQGPLATEEFLLDHPELNMELIFTTADETSKINSGDINNLSQINDPFNPELEDAHIITRNEDRTFTKNYSFNGN